MLNLETLRGDIVNIVRLEGPVLPIQISRKLNKDTLFAGAMLSELVKNKQIKITFAKVGGSPLYYVEGQESKLQQLYSYLPSKEKETYELLRKNQILNDEECDPAIRVALRSIKDFAIPFEINGKLYWRWYLTSEDEVKDLIKKTIDVKKVKEVKPEVKLRDDVGDEFFNVVKDYLKRQNIEVISLEVTRKKREIEGVLKINSDLGVLDYFFVAKNKKRISDADLSLVSDRGRKNKMPVLFLSNGELSKKTNKYLGENLRGRVIFRRI